MFELLNSIAEILRDLLPEKNQPLVVWCTRIFVLMFAFLGSFYLLFFSIRDTSLGEKYGINNPRIVLPTSTEYAHTNRYLLTILSKFKDQNIQYVSNIFLVSIYNKMSNDFVVKSQDENQDFFIWAWSIPVQKFSNLESVDYLLNSEKQFIFDTKITSNDQRHCVSGWLPDKISKRLKTIFVNETSNYYAICPIRDRSNKFTISYTISFLKVNDPLVFNMLVYKQHELTIEIGRVSSKYTIPYALKS